VIAARSAGWVVRTIGETLVASVPGARIGDGARIGRPPGVCGAIVAVDRNRATIVPFGALAGIAVGDRVVIDPTALAFPLGFACLGRVVDAAGVPLDAGPALAGAHRPIGSGLAPDPVDRQPIVEPFWTGVRAIDGPLTIGRGARVGFFGAPGAGKTTLLETIVTGARADAVVLALVGERGREAQTWAGRVDARTTIVCATSDRSAAERARAAEAAMAQACALRDHGCHVLLVVDSLARYAAALREQRVAIGEPVGRGGYPPSVWADLARYLERAGNAARGSVTLLATVLSDGSDEREPLSDAARSLLDGHVALSSDLARAGRYPAIDVLASASRTAQNVVSTAHAADAATLREALALLERTRDARDVGMATIGGALRRAVEVEPALEAFLRHRGSVAPNATLAGLRAVAGSLAR